MKKMEIGIVDIRYNRNGSVEWASFNPTMKVEFDKTVLHQLHTVESSEDVTKIQLNADLILAGWFSTLNYIELADPEETIISEVVKCEKYEDGKVMECAMKYFFNKKE